MRKIGAVEPFRPRVRAFRTTKRALCSWAPFYTIHKVMAGHLDMYTLAGNEQALENVEKMAGWVRSWSDPLSEQQMQRVLLVEYGGMGDVLANLYGVTGKREHLNLAKRFDKKWFFDPLAAHRDELKGLHDPETGTTSRKNIHPSLRRVSLQEIELGVTRMRLHTDTLVQDHHTHVQ